MNKAKLINISIDSEHNCETWWDNGGLELWQSFTRHFFCCVLGILVDKDSAESFQKDAAEIPGWDDEPFMFTEVEEE